MSRTGLCGFCPDFRNVLLTNNEVQEERSPFALEDVSTTNPSDFSPKWLKTDSLHFIPCISLRLGGEEGDDEEDAQNYIQHVFGPISYCLSRKIDIYSPILSKLTLIALYCELLFQALLELAEISGHWLNPLPTKIKG